MDSPFVSSRRRDHEDVAIGTKGEYTHNDYERFMKNSGVLYILQCGLDDQIFNHICSCEIAEDLWKKL